MNPEQAYEEQLREDRLRSEATRQKWFDQQEDLRIKLQERADHLARLKREEEENE